MQARCAGVPETVGGVTHCCGEPCSVLGRGYRTASGQRGGGGAGQGLSEGGQTERPGRVRRAAGPHPGSCFMGLLTPGMPWELGVIGAHLCARSEGPLSPIRVC